MSVIAGLFIATHAKAQNAEEPTECDRGVRRHHPSQANVYQVFTRKDFRKQWISYSCPEYKIFDPRSCECVSGRQVRLRPSGNDVNSRGEARGKSLPPSLLAEREFVRQRDKARRQNDVNKSQREGSSEDDTSVKEKSSKEPDCQLHRPTENPAVFERWSDGQWVQEDCNWPFYTGLVWSQDTCRCEWGPNRTLALPLMENGVPATCLMMLRMTFDNGEIRDEGRHIWLNVKHREGASVERDNTAVGGFAGSFRGSSIVVPYFKSNVLGDIFHVGFSFKLCPGNPDTDIVLLHNDCPEADDGPSLVISYQAWNRQLTVALRTINTDTLVEDICTLSSPQDQWTQIDVRYADSLMDISINDELCTRSDNHYGLVATNNCPFTLLGEAFCGSLDDVIITRGCTELHAVS